MFYAKLADVTPETPEIAAYPKTVAQAIAWLKSHDYAALPLGKTPIDGENIYINFSEYETKPGEKVVLESHRKYIDIQVMVEGEELMGYAVCTPDLPVLDGGYEYVWNNFPKNVRETSATPSLSNLRLSQGCELVIMYHLTASVPYFSIHSNGSTPLPRRFDILSPFLSSTRPFEITALYATESNTIVAIA